MQIARGTLLAVVLASQSALVQAATTNPAARLASLNQDRQFATAYAEARRLLPLHAGEVEFELQYAIAAIDSGAISEGIFALERLLLQQPDHPAAGLELARAYFLLGQYNRARQLFLDALTHNPPPDAKRRIELFLATLDSQQLDNRPSALQGYIQLHAGYDDNINSGPSQLSGLVVGNLQLSADNIQEREDSFTDLKAMARLRHDLSREWEWFAAGQVDNRFYSDETEFDNTSVSLTSGVVWKLPADRITLSVTGQHYILDHQTYRNLYGLAIEYQHAFSEHFAAGTFASFNRLEYANGQRDSDVALAGLTARWQFRSPLEPLFHAGLYLGDESAKASNALSDGSVTRDLYGGHAGIQLTLMPNLNLRSVWTAQRSHYAGPNLLSTSIHDRKDNYNALISELLWQHTEHTQLSLTHSIRDNDSNDGLQQYRRQQVEFGLRYQF